LISYCIVAISFLTRLPVGTAQSFTAKDVARSARWFPTVGALLGGISVAVLWLSRWVFQPAICAVLIVAVDAWITGALHYDGLADSADGLGGGHTREDALRIMRDHAIGSFGAATLILALALKIAAVAQITSTTGAFSALILAPVFGRWSAVLLSATHPYGRPPERDCVASLDSPSRLVGRKELLIATLTAAAVALIAAADLRRVILAFAIVAVIVALWGAYCKKRVGGITGDTIGAGIEISECLVLLLYAARY
jgi:cobalamin 5'-phosphate synthase/cobalamin synthase